MTGRGLMLCDDLIFASKVTATARARGLAVRVFRTAGDLQTHADSEWPGGVILDLHTPGLDVAAFVLSMRSGCHFPPFLLAFGSHVAADTLKAARAAGCDLVLPRSAFVAKLETDLPTWLDARTRFYSLLEGEG